MKRSQRSKAVMPSELINVEHPFYNSPSVHAAMLSDEVRTLAFKEALRKTAKDKNILEIGTGTGILALLAASAKANKIIASEAASETFDATKKIIKDNCQEAIISLVQYKGKDIKFQEKFDVIVSECLGHLGFDENMISAVVKYKKYLKKDGVFIPRKVILNLALVNNAEFYKNNLEYWDEKKYDFDMSAMKKIALRRIYVQTFKPQQILSSTSAIINYNLGENSAYRLEGTDHVKANKSGLVHGFAGWFIAELAEDIAINTSPFHPETHWEQCFMPFEKPIKVEKGDVLSIKLSVVSDKSSNKVKFRWEASCDKEKVIVGEAMV